MPYCPICRAEYRAGFNDCSGCFAGLVATREQAEAARVIVLWEGSNISKFDAIVDILRDADIPTHTKPGIEAKKDYVPFARITQFRKQVFRQVVVLEADYQRARSAAQSYL